jgi:tRNA pseudouridine55 synthase
MLEGILPILKPTGMTSHDVVAKARRLLKTKRIGHTGTLDPQVTGVLPLCIGRATRMVEYIQELPKEYVAELTVGYNTDTEDTHGEIVNQVEDVQLTEAQVLETLKTFVGTIEQVPPMYSAIKIKGKRLYELARQGIEIERKSRQVTIYELESMQMDLHRRHPIIEFRVLCSKGTYIRTLCFDIGQALGYPAVMSSLVRTKTGSMSKEQAITLEQVETLMEEGRLEEVLIPADQGVSHMTSIVVSDDIALKAKLGQKLDLGAVSDSLLNMDEEIIRLYSNEEQFLGLFQVMLEKNQVIPIKVFN